MSALNLLIGIILNNLDHWWIFLSESAHEDVSENFVGWTEQLTLICMAAEILDFTVFELQDGKPAFR